MGRALRKAAGGIIYHALNRANARLTVFEDEGDYAAFEKVLAQTVERMGTFTPLTRAMRRPATPWQCKSLRWK